MVSTRSLEMRVAVLALTLSIAVGSTMAATRTGQIAPFARSDALPIVDVHGHLNGDMSAAQLIDLMNQSGVRRMVLSSARPVTRSAHPVHGKLTDLEHFVDSPGE
jgi:hypothetical protein